MQSANLRFEFGETKNEKEQTVFEVSPKAFAK